MKCIIVDDDPLMVHILETLISEVDFLDVAGTASNINEAIKILETNKVDLIFLDVEMPQITGIEFLRVFQLNNTQVVIVSSHKKYAIESYEFEVADYLLKPIDKERFLKAVFKVKTKFTKTQKEKKNIFIRQNSSFQSIQLKEIEYIESVGDYITIHTESEKFTIHSSLKKMELLLPENEFIRIHNSYIIRIDKIMKYEDNLVYIRDTSIPVSRAQKNRLFDKLNIL